VIVSRAHLDALRAQKPLPPLVPSLQPNGYMVAAVNQQLEGQRNLSVQRGENVLNFAQSKMRLALNKARAEGFTRSHFNQVSHTHEFTP
jgi:hypothetical protein